MHDFREAGSAVVPTVVETEALGRELGAALSAGTLVILDGPLGAGKTALTRGIAVGLGAGGQVSSPTFVLAREHRPATRPDGTPGVGLVHVDAYRLLGADPEARAERTRAEVSAALDELDTLDLDTALLDSVVVIEWGRGLAEALADQFLLVTIVRPEGAGFDPEAQGPEPRTISWRWERAPRPTHPE